MLPRMVALPLAWEHPPALVLSDVENSFPWSAIPSAACSDSGLTLSMPGSLTELLFSEAVFCSVLALTTDFLVK